MFCSSFFVPLLSQCKVIMKKKQIRINFIDYLYYTIGTEVCGQQILLLPALWISLLIMIHFHIAWGILFAVLAGLLEYGLREIYYKREKAVRKYFNENKYGKPVWKGLAIGIWFILWGVVPFLVYSIHKGG